MSSERNIDKRAPLVLPVKFGPLSLAIREILNTHWLEINDDEFLQSVFETKPMVTTEKTKT